MKTTIVLTGGKWGTYGLRVTRKDRDTLFQGLDKVILYLPNDNDTTQSIEIGLDGSFWRNCHEFRRTAIGKWMQHRGDCPWPYQRPPKYQAEMTGYHIRLLYKID